MGTRWYWQFSKKSTCERTGVRRSLCGCYNSGNRSRRLCKKRKVRKLFHPQTNADRLPCRSKKCRFLYCTYGNMSGRPPADHGEPQSGRDKTYPLCYYSDLPNKTRIPDDVLDFFRKSGAIGGKRRAAKHTKAQLREWGRLGGRPRGSGNKQTKKGGK